MIATEKRTFVTMDRPHEIHPRIEVELTVRSGCKNDIEVCEENIVGDGYNLQRMQWVGFKPKTILDIGSHIGAFSAFAHAIWPDAEIVCVEPVPSSVELLKINCPFATVYEGAVGMAINVAVPKDGTYGGASAFFEVTNEHIIIKPEHIFFDAITCDMNEIDLLKLDCEGAEYSALTSLSIDVSSKIRCMIGEYHNSDSCEGDINAFYRIRHLIQEVCPWLTVITDEDRDPESALGRQIGPFLAFDAKRDRRLFETRRTTIPPTSHS